MSRRQDSIALQSAGPKARDLAKGSLDITAALLNATNASSPLLNLAIEVGEWIGREKVPKTALVECLQVSQSLTYPNDLGAEYCEKVKNKRSTKPMPALFLQQSGALGRRLLYDSELCWLVTTTTCLFQQHSDTNYIAQTLLEFVLRARALTDGFELHDSEAMHAPIRVRLRMVLEKFVLSVWQNVVNCEEFTLDLPDELKNVCRGNTHTIHQTMMGRLMHDIDRAQGNMVLQTTVFLNALYFWLMHHFVGELTVVISGKEVSKRTYGSRSIKLEMRVEYACNGNCADRSRVKSPVTLWTEVDGQQKQRKFSNPQFSTASPGARSKLYEIDNLVSSYHQDHRLQNRTLQQTIRGTAGRMLKWILSRPIVKPLNTYGYGFHITSEASFSKTETKLKVAEVLYRTPGLLNHSWPHKDVEIAVFSPAAQEERFPSEAGGPPSAARKLPLQPGEAPAEMSRLLQRFPILDDLSNEARQNCRCFHCGESNTHKEWRRDPGCVRVIALSEVLSYLAHGIADAMGCPDVSALSWRENSEPITAITMRVLDEICDNTMYWDTWFSLAAAVYTGCASELVGRLVTHFGGSGGDRDSPYAAIQYGNLAVIAPWLNLSRPMVMEQCFKAIFTAGRIATLTQRRGSESNFQEIGEDFAVIQPLPTESTSSHVRNSKKLAIVAGTNIAEDIDDSEVRIDMMLVADQQDKYRFFVRAYSNSHSRVVDPCHALFQRFRARTGATCNHQQSDCPSPMIPGDTYVLYQYTFDELLGRWAHRERLDREAAECPEGLDVERESSHIVGRQSSLSMALDTHLKFNLALAVSGPEPPMLRLTSGCSFCSLQRIHRDRIELSDGMEKPKKLSQHCYVITICGELVQRQRLLT